MQKLLTERDLENFLKELFNFHTNLKLEYIGIHFCRIHFHKNNSDQMSQCSQVSRITLLKGVLWEREVGRWVGMKVKDTCLFSSILFLTISGRPQPTFLKISIFFFFCNKYIFLSSMFHSVDDYDSCSELLLCICNWSWFWFVYPTFWRGYFLHHCANDIAATLWVITIFLAAKFTQKWKWKQKFTKINQHI